MLARLMAATPAVTKADQLTATGHVLGIHRHIQHLQLHAHGGQPVERLQETQRIVIRPVQRSYHQGVSGLYGVLQIIQPRSLEHSARDDVLVDMGRVDASASEAHPLVLQRVGSAVPATGYASVTVDRRIFYLAQAGCRKLGLTTPQGF